ncbi:MAG: B12-binding domain-containing radical SAM protein [Endomicrobiia bacterium]
MNILLVNPWIYDFAAYDLWVKPLGLLYISKILKTLGHTTYLIDALDRLHPSVKKSTPCSNKFGCGHYYKRPAEKPEILKSVPRKYKRYGMPEEIFINELKKNPEPEIVLVTSGMTYWYQGVFESIKIIRNILPKAYIVLGGIYATLCYEHAKKYSGADLVFSGKDIKKFFREIGMDDPKVPESFSEYPMPDFDIYPELEYVCLRTSVGCPFNCSYCATSFLNPEFEQKPVDTIIQEIEYFVEKLKIKNVVFYDDALLVNSRNHIEKILKGIIQKNIKCYFHTPNGLHARYITKELAELMYNAGFVFPRISLETSNQKLQKFTGNKVTNEELVQAIEYLCSAGYKSKEVIVYIMIGLPEQDLSDVEKTINFLKKLKVKISLSEYSPIPHTSDWEKVKKENLSDPLIHNNSLFSLNIYGEKLQKIKDVVRLYNYSLI